MKNHDFPPQCVDELKLGCVLNWIREWEPERWNARGERTNGAKQDTKLFNAYLDDLQSKAFEAHRQLTMLDELYTVEILRDRFLGKETKGINF